jgi:hypothetical protein
MSKQNNAVTGFALAAAAAGLICVGAGTLALNGRDRTAHEPDGNWTPQYLTFGVGVAGCAVWLFWPRQTGKPLVLKAMPPETPKPATDPAIIAARISAAVKFMRRFQPSGIWLLSDAKSSTRADGEEKATAWLNSRVK